MALVEARERLKDLDPRVRSRALGELIAACEAGEITCRPERPVVNMHCHTIFSYNGYGHSPTSLAWLAREEGWHAVGSVDFDVLDGVDEMLAACDRVGVRGAAGLETRVFLPEYSQWEFNSPGEPGVLYYVGAGFVSSKPTPDAVPVLVDMRERAAARNRDMVARINAYLAPVSIDYERDVLPLTPSGNATERHILVAYDAAARRRYPERAALLRFWAEKLGTSPEAVDAFLGEEPFPHDAIRAKLMKRGGVGYAQPGPETFPPLEEVNRAILACGALPSYAFLDGMNEGEAHLEELLTFLLGKGMVALTVIPDRNWNLANPAERAAKVQRLHQALALAHDLALPVIVGTEMNKPGQRILDDFEAEPLRPYRETFLAGADLLYGHTLLQRASGLGYGSAWAQKYLPDRRWRNAFYTAVGRAAAPGLEAVRRVATWLPADPDGLLARFQRG
ncbi:MAG: hypothetical protein H5T69_04700 [Chloroflexi bacterium]|nr:hypothetical protein [Chloroflexota bacterium]